MTWNAFKGKLVHEGVEYGSKGVEFEKLIELPRRVQVPLQVAVGGVDAPLARLERAGWRVLDGPTATATPEDYRRLIAGSRGEVSVAKNVYAALRSGWFSCRSACYLAAGRPVVVQDTGFSHLLPVGEGILTFTSADEAAERLCEAEAHHARHAQAAHAAAAECFGAAAVLRRLLEEALDGAG
jgi:hypothetical protein